MISPNDNSELGKDSPSDLFSSVMKLVKETERIANLSDEELSDLVINEIWSKFIFGSREDFLLDEMIKRFDKKSGIVRDKKGKIIKKG